MAEKVGRRVAGRHAPFAMTAVLRRVAGRIAPVMQHIHCPLRGEVFHGTASPRALPWAKYLCPLRGDCILSLTPHPSFDTSCSLPFTRRGIAGKIRTWR